MFLQIVKGVKTLHDGNFLHRDLKPSNVFITEEGVYKVGDYGTVCVADENKTQTVIMGGFYFFFYFFLFK
jgi:serine/threonine-protein kinase